MREHVNLQKKSATQKLEMHADAHVNRHKGTADSKYTPEEHAEAADAHAKESKNYTNSDKERAFHGEISNAHKALSEGKESPHSQREKKLDNAAASKERRENEKEAKREKKTVANAPGGTPIKDTHHVRFGGFGPEIKQGPKSASTSHKFASREWHPVDTDLGEHTPAEHLDIAEHHKTHAVHHAAQSNNKALPLVGYHEELGRMDHKRIAMNHQHAMQEHIARAHGVHHTESVARDAELEGSHAKASALRAEAVAKRAHLDANPNTPIEKSTPSVDLLKAEGSRGGIIIGHTKSGKPIYQSYMTQHQNGMSNWSVVDHWDAAETHRAAGGTGHENMAKMHDGHADKLKDVLHKVGAVATGKPSSPVREPKKKASKPSLAERKAREDAANVNTSASTNKLFKKSVPTVTKL